MTQRMASTEGRASIYREAARRIADKEPMMAFESCCGYDGGCLNSCCMVLGLTECKGDYDEEVKDQYAALFAPMENPPKISYWGQKWGRNQHQCRILALCFMAAMVEAGDA